MIAAEKKLRRNRPWQSGDSWKSVKSNWAEVKRWLQWSERWLQWHWVRGVVEVDVVTRPKDPLPRKPLLGDPLPLTRQLIRCL